jgi:hypothetical protein
MPQCKTYLGYKLYGNGHGWRCVNIQNDPANVCDPGHEARVAHSAHSAVASAVAARKATTARAAPSASRFVFMI